MTSTGGSRLKPLTSALERYAHSAVSEPRIPLCPLRQPLGKQHCRSIRLSSMTRPIAEKFPPHRRQGRLVAADRLRCRRSARGVARRAGRRHCKAARRGPRTADRLVGLDRARPQPPEIAARHAEARGKPGRRRGRADRAGADLVGGAGASRHRRRADPGDAAGHRGTPPLSQCALDHRQAAGMARGARDQRERHRRHQ